MGAISASQIEPLSRSFRTRRPAASERWWSSNPAGSAVQTRAGDPCLERKRDTRDESAAAAGHDDVVGSHVQISALLGDLETHGALACDDIEVVKCRHDHRLSLGSDPSGDLLAALAVAIVLDDARAERARVLELGARRVVRHDDRGRHLEQPGGGGHALRVVAGGVGDDAARRACGSSCARRL